jgi:hypothetical protein
MRFVKCGSKLFDPKAVTAVHLNFEFDGRTDAVKVFVSGDTLFFRGGTPEAEAVRAYFLSIPATDLLRRDEEAPEAVADNHNRGEC